MAPVKNVDEYIAQAPETERSRLKELRATILAAAPKAEERISYGMPSYHYKGRLLYFQLWKKHIGLYGVALTEARKKELARYLGDKGSIRLPLAEPLPVKLIQE